MVVLGGGRYKREPPSRYMYPKITKVAEEANLWSAPSNNMCSKYFELGNPTIVSQFEPQPLPQTYE